MNILANGNVAQRNKIFLKAQPVCFPGVLTSRDEGFAKGCRGCRDCMGSGGWGSGKWGINCKARHELKTRLGGGGELCSRVRGYGARHFLAASSVDGRRLPDFKGGGLISGGFGGFAAWPHLLLWQLICTYLQLKFGNSERKFQHPAWNKWMFVLSSHR